METIKSTIMTIAALLVALLLVPSAWAETYAVDPSHSQLGFAVKHMVIAKVKGTFDIYEGQFVLDKGKLISVSAGIDAASINTRIEKRDTHLRSEDFFDVAKHPRLTFTSKSITKEGAGYVVIGDLTIRGVTKQVELRGELIGPVKDPWGYERMGFLAKGTINRKDYGLAWNQTLETGGLLVGEDVELNIEGEGVLSK